MQERQSQTLLNGHLNDALADFLVENSADLETVLNGIADFTSDAVAIHQNWASSQEELLTPH